MTLISNGHHAGKTTQVYSCIASDMRPLHQNAGVSATARLANNKDDDVTYTFTIQPEFKKQDLE